MLLKISALWLDGEIEIAPGACKVFVQLPDGLGYCCRYFSFGGRLTGCGFVFGARKQHGLEMGISAAYFQYAQGRVDVSDERGHGQM